MASNKPVCYMLIGLPGCGKSTWVNDTIDHISMVHNGRTEVISSDNHIETYAKIRGKTYDQVFKDASIAASALMYKDLDNALAQGFNIIWDQTNLTPKAWTTKLEKIKKAGYETIAVWFQVSPKVCLERQAKRPGKAIPKFVMDSMIKSWEKISYDGLTKHFDSVIVVTK